MHRTNNPYDFQPDVYSITICWYFALLVNAYGNYNNPL
uniref:Uncharacterized protein n=1 Tax=Picea glauca TaxID=3330 RepID=A0A117NJF7_PICGL|nr:hypothetical protein ABT39_MTgene1230 [Picea glauca]